MYFGSSKPLHTYRFSHDCLEGNLNELNDFINDHFIHNLKPVTILIYLSKPKTHSLNGSPDLQSDNLCKMYALRFGIFVGELIGTTMTCTSNVLMQPLIRFRYLRDLAG